MNDFPYRDSSIQPRYSDARASSHQATPGFAQDYCHRNSGMGHMPAHPPPSASQTDAFATQDAILQQPQLQTSRFGPSPPNLFAGQMNGNAPNASYGTFQGASSLELLSHPGYQLSSSPHHQYCGLDQSFGGQASYMAQDYRSRFAASFEAAEPQDMPHSRSPRTCSSALTGAREYGPILNHATYSIHAHGDLLGPLAMPGTPRSVPSTAISTSPPATVRFSGVSSADYSANATLRDSMPFPEMECLKKLYRENPSNSSRIKVHPTIKAHVEKNVFYEDNTWKCYRRNYISVNCSYSLLGCEQNARVWLDDPDSGGKREIQALGVCLSATIDKPHGKNIALIQHTPKRDKGPRIEVAIVHLLPSSPDGGVNPPYHGAAAANTPLLPKQENEAQRTPGFSQSHHTFERIQFQQATANNGRRRAAQQFYHLIVELHADIRSPGDDTAKWVKIAQRISEPMVVRGRSPSHYKGDGSSDHSNIGGGSSSNGAGGGHTYGFAGGASGPRSSTSLPFLDGAHMGGGHTYTTRQFPPNPSPGAAHARPSPSVGSEAADDWVSVKSDPCASSFDAREVHSADCPQYLAGNYLELPTQTGFRVPNRVDHSPAMLGYGINDTNLKGEQGHWPPNPCRGYQPFNASAGFAHFPLNASY